MPRGGGLGLVRVLAAGLSSEMLVVHAVAGLPVPPLVNLTAMRRDAPASSRDTKRPDAAAAA